MRNTKFVVLAALLVTVPLIVSAHGHNRYSNGQNKQGSTHGSATGNHGNGYAGSTSSGSGGVLDDDTIPSPVTPAASEIRFVAYTTGYGYPDNTPAGNAISNPIIHSGAGGTGTYADPITLAVGHSITNGKILLTVRRQMI
jgi:hypothetical protein